MTIVYTFSTRPQSHPERGTCLAFVADLDPAALHAVTAATLTGVFLPAADLYRAARVTNETAATAVDRTSAAAAAAEAAFDGAFVTWTQWVDLVNGRGTAAKVLPPELGNRTVSSYLGLPDREKVDRMTPLLVHIDETPALVGDAGALQALREATAAYEGAVAAEEAARRDRALAVDALVAAAATFDRTYGLLVKDLKRYDAAGAGASVPTFRRKVAPARRARSLEAHGVPVPLALAEVVETEDSTGSKAA